MGAAIVSNRRRESQNCLESATHALRGVQNLYRSERNSLAESVAYLLKESRVFRDPYEPIRRRCDAAASTKSSIREIPELARGRVDPGRRCRRVASRAARTESGLRRMRGRARSTAATAAATRTRE